MEIVKTNKKICESIASIIDYDQYENLGKDFYNLGEDAKNDDCSRAFAATIKNYLTFNAMLELDPSMMLKSDFEQVYKPSIDFYANNNDSETPIYEQETMHESFYLGFFFNDLQKIYKIREENKKKKDCRSKVKLLKSNILFLAACDYYFDYFVGAYIAKLMLHLQVESKEEFESTKKFIKRSINDRNRKLLEFVLYRVNNYDESICESFDKMFGDQIIDDAMSGTLILDIISNYIKNADDIENTEIESDKLTKKRMNQKFLLKKLVGNGSKKSS